MLPDDTPLKAEPFIENGDLSLCAEPEMFVYPAGLGENIDDPTGKVLSIQDRIEEVLVVKEDPGLE